jgi:hypothetical protein
MYCRTGTTKRKTIYNKAARRRQLNLKTYWTVQCSRMLKYNIKIKFTEWFKAVEYRIRFQQFLQAMSDIKHVVSNSRKTSVYVVFTTLYLLPTSIRPMPGGSVT